MTNIVKKLWKTHARLHARKHTHARAHGYPTFRSLIYRHILESENQQRKERRVIAYDTSNPVLVKIIVNSRHKSISTAISESSPVKKSNIILWRSVSSWQEGRKAEREEGRKRGKRVGFSNVTKNKEKKKYCPVFRNPQWSPHQILQCTRQTLKNQLVIDNESHLNSCGNMEEKKIKEKEKSFT